ncbi:hypothetical protein L1887_23329 [Cichorium endivia]|nr:hypothetical protein L1887_23329 [Cichorium endivia]
MDSSSKSLSSVRKGKKKQVKDELDRIKQAEKKKRRLEKALATSAAIISELEKKKQKKKEEQQRLDEEGAATAEAVALQVLIGEEDMDDTMTRGSSQHEGFYRNRNEEFGWILNTHGGSRCEWNGYGYGYGYGYGCGDDVSSPGLMAAQAVSSLHIGDDEDMSGFVFNRMVRS